MQPNTQFTPTSGNDSTRQFSRVGAKNSERKKMQNWKMTDVNKCPEL